MTKPQSTAAYVLRLTLTLFLITVIVAGLLAFVNYLTADTIAEHTAEAARSAMTRVLAADDYTELPVSDAQAAAGVTAAWSAGDARTVVRLTTNGFGGAIDLMVGVDNENKVTGVAIISHSETASLGANCTREDFRAQFAGKTGELAVTKDGGDIDALTGATVPPTTFALPGPVQAVVTPPRRASPKASSCGLMESMARSCGVSGSTISL